MSAADTGASGGGAGGGAGGGGGGPSKRAASGGRLFFKNIGTLLTQDKDNREIKNAGIIVQGNVFEAVGPMSDMPPDAEAMADEVIDLSNHVVIPGLVNTHHHMFQSLTRVTAQNCELFDWLTTLYPLWRNIEPEDIYVSARTVMAEMLLTGCTTTSDHLYLYVNGSRLDDEIRAAQEIGIRFHAARGCMCVGKSKGGLPPDDIVEADEDAVLADMERLITTYHDAAPRSMLRVVIAPCAPFTVSNDMMLRSAELARRHPKVSLHTHLAENDKDISYSLEVYKKKPGIYARDLGWVGEDVWHAHCVKLDSEEIKMFAETKTGLTHCPVSNMRLASGIAPIREMLDAGVPVSIGVDGSASNDSSNVLAEVRMAMLLQRVAKGPQAMSAREALRVATLGGAQVLGRAGEIGAIEVGMAADFAAFRTDTHDMAGTGVDHAAALVFVTPPKTSYTVVNGRIVVREGVLLTGDIDTIVKEHNARSARLYELAEKAGLKLGAGGESVEH